MVMVRINKNVAAGVKDFFEWRNARHSSSSAIARRKTLLLTGGTMKRGRLRMLEEGLAAQIAEFKANFSDKDIEAVARSGR